MNCCSPRASGRYTIGGDPGLTGALVVASRWPQGSCRLEDVIDMREDPREISRRLFRWTVSWTIDYAVVEKVHAFPGQGVSSCFTFGFQAGLMRGLLVSCGISIILVEPSTWKARYGLGSGKDAARKKATEVFGGEDTWWQRKGQHGRAEAALLAVLEVGV